MIELKPCPFCGNEVGEPLPKRWTNVLGDESWSAYTHCPECNFNLETSRCGYKTPVDAIEAAAKKWNTRVIDIEVCEA